MDCLWVHGFINGLRPSYLGSASTGRLAKKRGAYFAQISEPQKLVSGVEIAPRGSLAIAVGSGRQAGFPRHRMTDANWTRKGSRQ